MPNNLHIKGSRTRVLNSFPTSTTGNDGDIIISRIRGRGVYLCTKAGGIWYVANKLQEIRNVENSSIENLKTNQITINKLVDATKNTDKFIVSDEGVLKYRTSGEVVDDLDIPIVDIYYKNAYCSLGQYNNEEDCIANGGEWYYSDNDSYDNISSSAENELLTIGRSIGNLDAEPTLLYDGSTLEIKYNSNYDDNWQTSAQTNLFKLSYDSSNNAIFDVDSSGDLTLDVSGDIELNADGGDIAFKDASADLAALSSSGLTISNISEVGSDTDKILMSDSGVVKYVTGANLRSYIGAGTSSVAALDDLSDVTYSSGDLTISSLDTIISGALLFDASGDIELESEGRVTIDKNIDDTTGAIHNALYVDLDRTGTVASGLDDTTAVNINSRVTGASGGTITNTGLIVTAIGDSGGSSTTNGLKVLANSADTNNGIYVSTTDGVGNDFKNVSSADAGDFFSINTSANGATTLATIDDDASAGHLTLDADGQIIIDSVNSSGAITDGTLFKTDGTTFGSITTHHALSCFTLFEAGGSSTDDYLEIQVDAAGATSINTVDAGGATAHLTLNPDGNVFVSGADLTLDATKKVGFDGSGGHTYVHEESDDFVNFVVGGQGLMAIQEKAGTSVAQSSKIYTGCPLMLKDIGGVADNPVTGYGSVYVNSDTLYFKDDGGSTYNVHRGGKWQKTCGGYKTNNTSTSNYYYQYYVNYHSWSAYDCSPTTLGSSGTPAKDYVWKAPAAGTLTNIYVSARTYDTGYDDPFKFYVFKGTPADGDQNVSLTQIGVTGAIQASVTNRINIVSTDITSSNTFNAGECLWVMLKKDSSSGNLDAYFNVTIKGDFT